MQLTVYPTSWKLSAAVAETICQVIKKKPDAVLCLAAGDTPREAYQMLAEMIQTERVDVSRVRFVGLDEWVGIPEDNSGTCAWFLKKNIFEPMHIQPQQIRLFNGMADDMEEECRQVNEHIVRCGGIDLMLVGVGMNGHIGFNEPGVSFTKQAHVVQLDEVTQTVGQKYFKTHTPISKGVTLGLKTVAESRRVIMMANASKKASIMQQAIEGPVTEKVPASFIQTIPHAETLLDADAAALLQKKA